MKIYGKENKNLGMTILIYGRTGSGKTYSAVTLPQPILFINKEPKDPRVVHSQFLESTDITYVEPESFDDICGFLNEAIEKARNNEFKFKSLFHDGLTFSNAIYKRYIEDSLYESKQKRKNDIINLELIDQFVVEQRGWGAIASMMSRESYLLNSLSKYGVIVVSTAVSTESQSYDKYSRIAPSLMGQEFPKLIHGYFDYIGYIIEPFAFDGDGKPIQPRVSFVSPRDEFGRTSYMARTSSSVLAEAEAKHGYPPLDFRKILSVIHGERR